MFLRRAFTLAEILIVLAIISVGLALLAPVAGERMVRGDSQIAFFTELLEEHLSLAKMQGAPVTILGFKGSANIVKYDGERTSIPGIRSVQSVWINDQNTPGIEYEITVYPDGLCDHFVIETDGGLTFESYPILMTVTKSRP